MKFLFLLLFVGCTQVNAVPPEVKPLPKPVQPATHKNFLEIHSDAEYAAKMNEINSVKGWRYIECFSASWCGPCQQLAPIYKKVADENKHVLFLKIDIDACPQAAKINRVTNIPCIVLKEKHYVGLTTEANLKNVVRETFPQNQKVRK